MEVPVMTNTPKTGFGGAVANIEQQCWDAIGEWMDSHPECKTPREFEEAYTKDVENGNHLLQVVNKVLEAVSPLFGLHQLKTIDYNVVTDDVRAGLYTFFDEVIPVEEDAPAK